VTSLKRLPDTWLVAAFANALLPLAACAQSTPAPTATAVPVAAPAARITIEDVWAEAAMFSDASMSSTEVSSAAYMVLVKSGNLDDTLVDVFAEVADKTELHLSALVDGAMKMTPVDEIRVPAGRRTELVPGGPHVMMISLTRSLEPGDRILIALRFKTSGDQLVVAGARRP
jgi:copper(I)-binding protein